MQIKLADCGRLIYSLIIIIIVLFLTLGKIQRCLRFIIIIIIIKKFYPRYSVPEGA